MDKQQLPPELLLNNLEALLEYFDITLFAVDIKGKVIYQNKALCRHTGGKKRANTIDPDAWADCQAIMASKTPQTREEVYQGLTFQSFKKPIIDAQGNTLGVMGVAFNISARKAAEKHFQQAKQKAEDARKLADNANQMKTRFINNISRTLRLPYIDSLGLITHHLTDNAEKFYSSPHYETYLELSAINIRALKDIDGLLDYVARLDKSSGDYTPIELAPFCKSIIERYEFVAYKAGIKLRVDVSEKLPARIVSSNSMLTTLLSCLIDNAIKFREKKTGEVYLTVEPVSHKDIPMLKWCVQDDGVGIDARHQRLIFEDFRRVTPATQKRYSGIGLGLSKVKDCLKKLGGEIEVTSELGKGACFTCFIPLCEEPLPAQQKPITLHPYHLLVIADNDTATIDGKLKKLGCQVDIAKSGKRVLDAVKQHTYDLIFIAVESLLIDGVETARRIRHWEETRPNTMPRLPIVALTTQIISIALLTKCLEAGMQEALEKPLSPEMALCLLDQYCASEAQVRKTLALPAQPKKNNNDRLKRAATP